MAHVDPLAAAPAPAKAIHWLKDLPRVAHGSAAHEQLLAVGYKLTADEAREIIATRKKDPAAYSLAEVRQAEAMLAALAAKPTISATRAMWKRPLSAD